MSDRSADPPGHDADDPAPDVVRAGGGLVWRLGGAGEVEVLLVHRPRYDDWSFPKGKCDRSEGFVEAALREVAEETGFACELGAALDSVTYVDHKGRPKEVRYWAMTVLGGAFEPNDEVDEICWMTTDVASAALSRPDDAALLDHLDHHLGLRA